MARPTVKDADFVGRRRTSRSGRAAPVAVLCTLTVDDPTSKSGVKRYMLGPRADPDAATARRSSTRRAAART